MTLNQLIYFCRLAESEHYGQAAKALFISQPSLSKSMAQLEHELGVTLFERRGRNVTLSRAGQVFFQHIKPALEQIDSARELMQQYSSVHRLPVIGCVSPAVTSVLAPLLDSYRIEGNSYPQVVLKVDISEALVEALRNGECDMAFSNAPAYNSILERIFERYDIHPVVHSYANDDTALFGMVRAGAAIFITSDYPQIYSNGLAIRRLDQDVCQREICLAYTDRSRRHPVIASMLEFMEKYRTRQLLNDN